MRMLEHSFEPEAEVRRVEVITGTGRRRRWSVDDKAPDHCGDVGAGRGDVLRSRGRHRMSPQQIFGWRRGSQAALWRRRIMRARLCASGAGNALRHEQPPAAAGR